MPPGNKNWKPRTFRLFFQKNSISIQQTFMILCLRRIQQTAAYTNHHAQDMIICYRPRRLLILHPHNLATGEFLMRIFSLQVMGFLPSKPDWFSSCIKEGTSNGNLNCCLSIARLRSPFSLALGFGYHPQARHLLLMRTVPHRADTKPSFCFLEGVTALHSKRKNPVASYIFFLDMYLFSVSKVASTHLNATHPEQPLPTSHQGIPSIVGVG